MNNQNSYSIVCRYIPQQMRKYLEAVSIADREKINEVRLRVNRPITVSQGGKKYFVTKSGGLTTESSMGTVTDSECINNTLKAICKFSVHSYVKELSKGYITIDNGIRVGIAGSFSGEENDSLKYINAVNFRISRQIKGCSDIICRNLLSAKPCGIIICGGVASGKTTLLRDICRNIGSRHIVTLVDERGELAGCNCGVPLNDIGYFTDVLEGCSRSEGIISAIRSLSPEVIICDEISSQNDSDAILQGAGCGVKFIASAHAEKISDLYKKEFMKKLIDNSIFDYAVLLAGSKAPGMIKEIRSLKHD